MARAAAYYPGRHMASEVQEQPDEWRRILAEPAAIAEVAGRLVTRRPRFVLLVARGGDPDAPRGLSKVTETL